MQFFTGFESFRDLQKPPFNPLNYRANGSAKVYLFSFNQTRTKKPQSSLRATIYEGDPQD
jgi:hypothetical protein